MGHRKGISLFILAITVLLAGGGPGSAEATPADATAGAADKSLVIDGFAQVRYEVDHIGERPAVPGNDLNYFQLRRMRLRITGDWNQYFRVRIQLALQELVREFVNNQVLEDMFVRVRKSDAVEFQLGQYKMPISREELRSSSDQLVIDRSPIVNANFRRSLLISRDIGLQFGGNLYEHHVPFEYYAGVWNGEGRNNPFDFIDRNDTKLFGGRAEYAIVPGVEVAGGMLFSPIRSGAGIYQFGTGIFTVPEADDYSELARIYNLDGNFTHPFESGRLIVEAELLDGTNTVRYAGAMAAALADTTGLAELPKPGDSAFRHRGMQVAGNVLLRNAGMFTGWEVGGRLAHYDPNLDADDDTVLETTVALGFHLLPDPTFNNDRLMFEFANFSRAAPGVHDDWTFKAQWQVRY
ncbi:MAG TPA: porin [Candidatus Udaeobacter sp.]|nr:porin [Candidatus Udaeobacter sp.]